MSDKTKAIFELEPPFLIGFPPPENVAEALNPFGLDLVTRFTDAPIASASMSGVNVFLTSMDSIILVGIRSNCIFLLSPSAEGNLSPLRVTELS